ALDERATHRGVTMVRKLFGELAELGAHGIGCKIDSLLVMGRDCLAQHQRKRLDFPVAGRPAIAVERPTCGPNSPPIGSEVAAVANREAEAVSAIEIFNDLLKRVVAAVMEVRRVEIPIEQGRSLEQAARSDVVLHMIDKGAGRLMAARATQRGIV